MKNLKNKNSRRRGVAIELAISLLLIMTAMSTIILTTTMIQVNKQAQSINDLKEIIEEYEKIEYDQIGEYFELLINEEYKEINNENKLLPISSKNETYTSEKKDYLTKKLKTKFKYFIKDKGLAFNVTVLIDIKSVDNSDNSKNENNQIIKTHIEDYEYELIYKLTVNKSLESVFESEYKIKFKRKVVNISTQESVEEPILENTYYWIDVLSDTIDNLSPLFTIQGGYKFQMIFPYIPNYVIEVYNDSLENDLESLAEGAEDNWISFENVESNTEYIYKITYNVVVDEEVPDQNQPEIVEDSGNDGETDLDETITETKTLYFKVLVTKDVPVQSEPSLVDVPSLEEGVEEKTPANEENYEIMLLKQTGVNYVPKDGTEPVITTNYEVNEKKLEKIKWESK